MLQLNLHYNEACYNAFLYQGSTVSPRIQKILRICKWTDPRSTHTSVTITDSLPPAAVLAGHRVTVSRRTRPRHPGAGGNLPPSEMHRNATRRNDLHENEIVDTARTAVSSRYKKNEKTKTAVLFKNQTENRTNLKKKNRNRHTANLVHQSRKKLCNELVPAGRVF